MSTTTLRHYFHTLSYLPRRRDEQMVKGLRLLKIRTSRRRLKQSFRHLINHHIVSQFV